MNKKPDYIADDAWLLYCDGKLGWRATCSISCSYWWRLKLFEKAQEAARAVNKEPKHGSNS